MEGQAITIRWKSSTHSYLSPQPLDSILLIGELVGTLDRTGSFPPPQQSLETVQTAAPEPTQTVALDRIESIIQISQRLETAFMIDVASSDLSLLYGDPDTMFDKAKMANEFGSDSACKPGEEGKIVGTTEVGVEKSICGQGETRPAETVLKVKVVLEKDVVGDGK